MSESQPRNIVHAYNALETRELGSIIHFGLFKLFGDVNGLGEINRGVVLDRHRLGVAKQGVVIVVYDMLVRVGTERHDSLALVAMGGAC